MKDRMPTAISSRSRTKFIVGASTFTLSALSIAALVVTGMFNPRVVSSLNAQSAGTAVAAQKCEKPFFVKAPKASPTPTPPVCNNPQAVDITFVLDHSGSMARRRLDYNCNGQRDTADGDRVEDLRQKKLERVKQATKEVISSIYDVDTKNQVRIGLIKFSTCNRPDDERGTKLLSPLVGKAGRSALMSAIDTLQIPIDVNDWNTGGGYNTCTHEGLNLAANQAKMGNDPKAKQVVILLTDGRPYHTSNPNEPLNRSVMEKNAIESAVALGLKNYGSSNSNGVKVITVGVGDPVLPDGAKVCGWDPLKSELMACIAGVYDKDADGNFDNDYTIPSYDWDGFPVQGPTLQTQCRPDRSRKGSAHVIVNPETDTKNILNDIMKDVLTENCVGGSTATVNNRFQNTFENVSEF